MNVLTVRIMMNVLFILLFMISFFVIYLLSKMLSVICILLANFGCFPVIGHISLFFLWKNPKSPGFEILG